MSKRNAVIGYATVWLGRRLTERLVRRHVRRRISELLSGDQPSRLRRRLPLVGAAAALGAVVAVVFTRQRT